MKDDDLADVPPELAAWWPEQTPENENVRCRNGCCRGPYCAHTYRTRGIAAAIVEAYAPPKPTVRERLQALLRAWKR